MENINVKPDEKRLLLKDYNHRINNDLQALLAFIKLQKRFGIDDGEIVNFTCVSIASISSIQNLMYYSHSDENLISVSGFFEDFVKILDDHYSKYNVRFSNKNENDFQMMPKKIFHLMFLASEIVNLSIASFKDDLDHEISFHIEKIGDECLFTYLDGSDIKLTMSQSDSRNILIEQLIKQIGGTLQSDDDSIISIKFNCE